MTRSLSRSRVVPAAPEVVFDLLADPRSHASIDGSGMLRSLVDGPVRLTKGARFGMRMHHGLPYFVRNTVVEFEEGRRIAWRHWHRHIWRYELVPAGAGTRVTETFDWSTSLAPRALELLRFPGKNANSMEATLSRLESVLENRSPAA